MKTPILSIVFAMLVIFIMVNSYVFFPGNILSWDVFGYYLYLPFSWIYNDLGLKDDAVVYSIIEKYNNTATFYQAMKMPEGHYVMKYSMGMALFYAPFFFIGHCIALISAYPADGFSLPYQHAIFFGGILYAILGVWALSRVLVRFFSQSVVALVLFVTVFATNYLLHVTMYGQNAMPHNYLFTTYALIIWVTILWHESLKIRYLVFLAVLCGLTILSRPSEIVCLLIPLLWGVWDKSSGIEKIKLLFRHKKQIIIFAGVLFLIGSMQFIYWRIYAGTWLFNSYSGNAGEGFDFLTPHFWQVLFSFRKGWLIYTPLMIFAIMGFWFLYKKNKMVFYALFTYFILNLYIVSSWSCWWYAQSFGQRAMIPSYPIMAIGMGYFFTWLSGQKMIFRRFIYLLIAGMTFLNLYQSRQFHLGVIHGDRMTKAYYLAVFGKMYASEEDKKLLLIDRPADGVEVFSDQHDYQEVMSRKIDFEQVLNADSAFAFSGARSFRMNGEVPFSPVIDIPYYELTEQDHAWIRVSAYVYPVEDPVENPFCLVAHFNHKNAPYKYRTYGSEQMNLELNKWNKVQFDYLTPEVRRVADRLKVYLWLRGNKDVYIDDLQVDVYEKR